MRASDWEIFDGFSIPPASEPLAWSEVEALEAAAAGAVEPAVEQALDLCRRWDERLSALEEGASSRDWSRFRPLRLSREEDWSDWLAFLLEAAPPRLREELLDLAGDGWVAKREVVVGAYRADLILEAGKRRASIEVKLDDLDLEKTFDCCTSLEAAGGLEWQHWILLPEERFDEWREVSARRPSTGQPFVRPLSWSKLASVLRRALWRHDGGLAWQAWALAFCRAVEQQILGLPSKPELLESRSISRLGQALRLLVHLSTSLEGLDGIAG